MSTPTNEKKLFLLDAYALIFRAYYAFIKNPRYNTKGLNTSAVLGFTNSLDEILRKEKPSHIAVVFDPPGPTFRNEMFKEYKANRDETPEDIKKSVPYIKQVIKGFNIPVIEAEGFEADDTIGTLAKQAEKEGFTVYMVTPDKDFGQLVSDNIFMYKPKRGGKDNEILGKKEICELYGIEQPEQVIDILSIWGDAADNIPGIKGIGKKTSKKLIAKFGSTEELFKNSHLLKGKQKENVEDSEEKIKLSKILVTIRTDVPVNFDAKMYTLDSPNKQELLSLFEELEFRALSTRIFPNETTQSSTVSNSPQQQSLFGNSEKTEEVVTSGYSSYNDKKHSYSKVETAYEIEELKDKLLKQKEFSFDTETTSINALQAELVGISFAWEENKAYYIPFPEDREAAMEILAILTPVFENHTILKIGQNLKYDYTVLRNYNIRVAGPLFDTMIAHYLIDTNGKHNLTALSKQYLNYEPIEIESLTGKKVKEGAMRRADPDKVSIYAGEDSDLCLKLKPILWDELEKNNLRKPAEVIEFPLIAVLSEMERTGVSLDTGKLSSYEKLLISKLKQTENKIFELAGNEFNISSPKQLGIVLFEKLKIIDNPKLTKTKQYATGESELIKLKGKHDIISHILDFRSKSKLLSTYVKALPLLLNEKTKKIHSTFNQAVVSTGRLSSTNPNLQNIPVRTPEGKEIRKCFIPSNKENILIAADYSQIELRIMAHLSADENLIKAFKNQEDIHTSTASKVFDVPQEEVTGEMRSQAKSANFGIIYGISAFGLAQNLDISRSKAKELIDGYFKTYPDVKTYMERSIATARDQGFVTTIYNRKRLLRNINSRNGLLRSNDERNAINSPIQGTASDIIKLAMTACQAKLNETNAETKMILQVHDELVFDAPKHEVESVTKIIREAMENAAQLSVDLKVDIGIGNNWLEAH